MYNETCLSSSLSSHLLSHMRSSAESPGGKSTTSSLFDECPSSSSPASGEAFVNVTVLKPKRVNQAPIALINPTTLEVKEGNTAILDGSQSKDDDKIDSFKWEEIEGPVETQVSSIPWSFKNS